MSSLRSEDKIVTQRKWAILYREAYIQGGSEYNTPADNMQFLRNQLPDFKNSWSCLILILLRIEPTAPLIIQPHYRVKHWPWKSQFSQEDFCLPVKFAKKVFFTDVNNFFPNPPVLLNIKMIVFGLRARKRCGQKSPSRKGEICQPRHALCWCVLCAKFLRFLRIAYIFTYLQRIWADISLLREVYLYIMQSTIHYFDLLGPVRQQVYIQRFDMLRYCALVVRFRVFFLDKLSNLSLIWICCRLSSCCGFACTACCRATTRYSNP